MRNDISEIAGSASPMRSANPNLEPTSIGDAATQIAEVLSHHHVVFLARDEQRAEAIAAALRAAAPECVTVHFPSSDALPGDIAPASPANVGHRVAALRRLRLALRSDEKVALIATGEAAARLYPRPNCFDAAPPRVKAGSTIDIAALAAQLLEIGYSDDDRVDEPGEVAVRGQVIDIFPANADMPVRLEISEGRITDIRAFDPATQRGLEALETVEVGRATEPRDPPDVTLFEHLPAASVLFEPGALERRDRFVTLADDASRRRGESASEAANASRWTRALGKVEPRQVLARGDGAPRRFAEDRSPLRAAARSIKHMLGDEVRVLLVGAPRDLRFLSRRLAKAAGEFADTASWAAVLGAKAGSLMILPMVVDRGWSAPGVTVIAAADILGSRAIRLTDANASVKHPVFGSGEIRLGDVVVHEEHGIGRVSGLQKLATGTATESEGLYLEYAGGAKRILPLEEADRLWRYGADADAVTLDRLDGGSWRNAVKRSIRRSPRARPCWPNWRRSAHAKPRLSSRPRKATTSVLPRDSALPKRRIKPARLRPCATTSAGALPWIGWLSAMSVTAKPKLSCARRRLPRFPASRSQSPRRRRFLCVSTSIILHGVSSRSAFAWRACRVYPPPLRKKPSKPV